MPSYASSMLDSTQLLPIGALCAVIAAAAVGWHDFADIDPLDAIASAVVDQGLDGDLVLLADHDLHFETPRFAPLVAIATDRIPPELNRVPRVFVVSETDDTPGALEASVSRNGTRLWSHQNEAWRAELYQMRSAAVPVDDLGAQLALADVELVSPEGSGTEACPWDGDRFRCPGEEWVWVGPTVQVFAGQPHRCVWAHPSSLADLRITFRHVAGATHVEGWFGLTDYAASIPDGGRVTLELRAGSQTRAFTAQHTRGRRVLDWALPANHDGPLEMTIRADHAGVRHFCWDIRTSLRATGPAT